MQVWATKDLTYDATTPAKLRVTAAVAAHDKDINAVAVAPNDSGALCPKWPPKWPPKHFAIANRHVQLRSKCRWLHGHICGHKLLCAVMCTGSQDRTAKIWKLPNLVLSLTLKGHKRGIWAVAFSPVDQAVATASGGSYFDWPPVGSHQAWHLHCTACFDLPHGIWDRVADF